MKVARLITLIIIIVIPLLSAEMVSANNASREGKVEWFINDMSRLNNAESFGSEVASVWFADKLAEGGYVLPGSQLNLNYRSQHFRYLSMLQYSPNGQISPLFINEYKYSSPVRSQVMRHRIQVSPVEGRAAVVLIASSRELSRDAIAHIAKNPDSTDFPDSVEAIGFAHFIIEDYMRSHRDSRKPDQRSGGYNAPQERHQTSPQQWRSHSGGYNEPMYYPGNMYPQHGPYGPEPIPLSQIGSTYYFYPDGQVSRNFNPYYYYPYYYHRPMHYGYFGDQRGIYYPNGQRYYVIPGDQGARTNLQDFIFQANTKYGSFFFGDGGFLGGRFHFDGRNPTPDGLVFRFPVKSTWEHEGPDGSWKMDVPSDFEFYLNGRLIPIYGGIGDPFVSIPLQGFLINGLNEFRLVPRRHQNLYGIGPIEIVADIRF